uniref:DUF2934 domain-containing protein n=1 Tax=Pseudomonas aeruginosa TaxID=287 RepID=A0A5E5QUU4_PSEAI|nr:hypothetical protein TUEID40_00369 [Pseudomonas aeruginosa]
MQPGLFRDGDYLPLEVSGEHAERVLAFARRSRHGCLLVVVPRLACALLGHATQPQVPAEAWGDTCLLLPPRSLRMHLQRPVFHHAAAQRRAPEPVEVLADFPVNLLYRLAQEDTRRAPTKNAYEFAYQIWESEGCPDSQAERHWAMARQLAEAEAAAAAPKKTRGRAKAAKKPGPAASAGRQAAQAEGRVPSAARQRKTGGGQAAQPPQARSGRMRSPVHEQKA